MATPKKPHPAFGAGDEHSGRDEMNLAGHPFALLQSPKRQSGTSISYEWKHTVRGREVTASWCVETPETYGLPGPEEELVYLVMMQLTREAAEAAGYAVRLAGYGLFLAPRFLGTRGLGYGRQAL